MTTLLPGSLDDELHVVSGDQLLLVLRSRQQVEDAMVDYHNELNHLDASKCLRLLYERWVLLEFCHDAWTMFPLVLLC